jgi:predicted dehydrogenase
MIGQSALRIALIGYGRQGKTHFQALQPFVRLGVVRMCGICDVLPQAKETAVPCFVSVHELLAHTRPDVVIITVPNVYHFSIAKEALEFGCDVIKEKPLAITLEEGRELLELSKFCGKLVITLQQRFYQPLFQTLAQLLPSIGSISRFSYLFTVNDKQKSWYWERELSGGGSWLNMGWHCVSVLHWLFGVPKNVSVSWNIGGQRDWHYDTDHSALAKLQFAKNISGSVFVSCIYPKEESLRIYGKEGSAVLNRDGLTVTLKTGKIVCSTATPLEESYVEQYKAVFSALYTRSYPSERDFNILETLCQGSSSAFESKDISTSQREQYAFLR